MATIKTKLKKVECGKCWEESSSERCVKVAHGAQPKSCLVTVPESNDGDPRTDEQIVAAVEKRSGDHYEILGGKPGILGGYPLYNKFNGPGCIPEIKSVPVIEDRIVKGQGDFPYLRAQIKDYYTNFYGPSVCEGCGRHGVIRSEMYTACAVTSWEECGETVKSYRVHHCTHISLFKSLAGKVLTVIDASLTHNPTQHKAVKDLLRKAFSETISHARELEGCHNGESVSREELA